MRSAQGRNHRRGEAARPHARVADPLGVDGVRPWVGPRIAPMRAGWAVLHTSRSPNRRLSRRKGTSVDHVEGRWFQPRRRISLRSSARYWEGPVFTPINASFSMTSRNGVISERTRSAREINTRLGSAASTSRRPPSPELWIRSSRTDARPGLFFNIRTPEDGPLDAFGKYIDSAAACFVKDAGLDGDRLE
jgi:hypothetical protein